LLKLFGRSRGCYGFLVRRTPLQLTGLDDSASFRRRLAIGQLRQAFLVDTGARDPLTLALVTALPVVLS
jgi:hypothetical protein